MVGSTRPATATGADGPANTTQLDTLKSPNRGKGGMTNAKLDDELGTVASLKLDPKGSGYWEAPSFREGAIR